MTDPFTHPALLYQDESEYVATTLPFIGAGLARDEPVLVAVPTANLDLIRDALGTDARQVVLRDMKVAGRNPGRIIPNVLYSFVDAHRGRRVRIVGEPAWPGRTFAEYAACMVHEALTNAAFAEQPVSILCPYDAQRLAPEWLAAAHRTHPSTLTPHGPADSPAYADPIAAARAFNQPLPDPPADAVTVVIEPTNLAPLRRWTADLATAGGLPPDRVADLVIAVNELATNSIEHGGGRGEIAQWVRGGELIYQVRDRGYIPDPLAGRIPVPAATATGGRGLLLVNQLCDLVQIHSRPGGTTIQVNVALR